MTVSITVCLVADSLYKNWWEPPDDVIIIKPSDMTATQPGNDDSKSGKAKTVSTPTSWVINSPSVPVFRMRRRHSKKTVNCSPLTPWLQPRDTLTLMNKPKM